METLLNAALCNALLASVLAIGVVLVTRWVRKTALVHSLWLLVLLKLITPPLVSVPVLLPGKLRQEAPLLAPAPAPEAPRPFELTRDFTVMIEPVEAQIAIEVPEPVIVPLVINPVISDSFQPPVPIEPIAAPAAFTPASVPRWRVPPWRSVLLGAWAAGSSLWLCLAAWRIARFGWLVRQAEPAPFEIRERVEQLCVRLGIAANPRVVLVPGCVSPLIWALSGPPRLLLPAELWDRLDYDQRDALLVHELAHLKRRDHWIRNLELLVTGFYWWHPIVWWARRALREAEEQCCDAWVVWALPTSARAYATALLQTVDFLSSTRPPPSLPMAASGLGHLSSLKRRLTMIMQEPTPRALSWAGRLAVLGLAALLLPVAPTWAQREVSDDLAPPQQQAGRADSDDDDKDDDDDSRDRAKADRKSKEDAERADKLRESQLEKARAQVKKMTDQFVERRKQMEAAFDKARTQLEVQMREANRALDQAQEQVQKALDRVSELEGGDHAASVRRGRRPGDDADGDRRGRQSEERRFFEFRFPGPNPGGSDDVNREEMRRNPDNQVNPTFLFIDAIGGGAALVVVLPCRRHLPVVPA